MRKIKYLLLVAIISFFVLPSESKAACGLPSTPMTSLLTNYGWDGLRRGYTYTFYVTVEGGNCPNTYLEYSFNYDEQIF